jgi:hypothetical protein
MARRHLFYSLFAIVLIVASAGIPVESRGSAALQAQEKKLSAGRNVNMVSGMTLPNGDPYLQRQNEPSMAVSTRNPLHILAGSNDYRTVDMPLGNEQLPGRQGPLAAAAPDAWLGLYKSFDGGQSWASTLLPGFPQDLSTQGKASPLKFNTSKKTGFTAAADPVVRSGPSGMFYYSGIAFNRTRINGWINGALFISRFIDANNAEAGDSIQYIDTQVIANDNHVASYFIDKPWIAVDAPLPGAPNVNINGQMIPRHNVYIAYSTFLQTGNTEMSLIVFRRSTDCGKTWGTPLFLSPGDPLNQGATIAIDPRDNGNVYVAWRRFDTKRNTSAIMVARSRTKGASFESARTAAAFPTTQGPFDQPSGTTTTAPGASFRTNSYPTMAVDDKGIVYLAWAQRGYGPTGESRIVLATSSDGLAWTQRGPIDSPGYILGHQFMPSLAFAAGKLTMAWYDQRDDYCANNFGFNAWIVENLFYRHTIDVRAAQADTAGFPNLKWDTVQISRYHFTLEEDHEHSGKYKAFQAQWNPPNYPLFATGTTPFQGDYLDVVASPAFVRGLDGRWRFNTAVSDNPLFHVTWTDNRDVRPPASGNWADYAPPTSAQLAEYISPGRPVCTGGQQPGMRNQNVYTAQLVSGIGTGSPTNAKTLDLDVPRAFAVFVKNNTEAMKSFRLTIAAQPPSGQASFLQFDPLDYLDVTIAPYSTISRQVFVNSTNSRASVTVLIDEIDVPDGSVLPDGMKSSVILNGDPASSGVVGGEETHQPQIENPHIRNWSVNAVAVNPEIDNEDIVNTDIVNPNIVDLGASNPAIVNPNVVDPSLFNPHIRNTDYLNPNIVNPHIRNPHIRNESPEDLSVTDVEWPVKNIGNTASSFSFTLIAKEALPEGLYAQLIVYKVHYTPAVAGGELAGNMNISGCELKQEPHHEVLLNVVNPDIVNPHIRNPNLLNPHIRNAAIENATFALGPGEEAIVNLRIIESHEKTGMTRAMTTLQGFELPVDVGNFIESIGAAVTAQSVDSEDAAQGIEEPKTDATTLVITTSSLPPGLLSEPYPSSPNPLEAAQLQAVGGTGSYSWWVNPDELPLGLSLNAASGQISGVPLRVTGTYPRVYSFTVQVTDSGSPQQSANQRFNIAIEDRDPVEPPPPLSITTPSPLPTGTEGTPYGTALNAVGGVWPYTWTRVSGSFPQGLSMDELGTIGGTPSLAGTFAFSIRVVDSASPAQSQEKAYSLTIRAADAPTFSISGRVTLGGGGGSLPGVLMRGLPSAPTTDASGSYSDTVPAGWSGAAIPFKAGYYFVPAEISYANVQSHRLGQNYIAYPVTLDHFDISSIGNAIAGVPFPVTITAKDDRGETVTTYTDSNMLSDTTGTLSPTMTAPFTNGVWTGQVAIMKTAQGVVIQTSGGGRMSQSNSFNVALGSPSAIRIEDAPDGTGTEVVTKTLGPGHALTVYAVSRDLGNNFVANVAVDWSLLVQAGGIVDGDLVPAGNNMSAVFTARTAGAARIRAQHASLGADTTGTITVMETMVDDLYEDNDDLVHAAPLPLGAHSDLVLMDPDWFKVTISAADAGKDLMIRLKGVSYPDPDTRKDLDMLVLDGSGRLMGYNISGGDDEYAFIPGVAAGDYTIGLIYIPIEGVVYSLTAEVGTNFGIGYIEGRVTDKNGYGLENILVELYGDPFNWDISRPMTTTGANGLYKIGFFPGRYTVLFNITNPDWRDPSVPDVNYLGETYHGNEVVTLVAGATVQGINTQLEPGGAITGRVTDSSGNGLKMAVFYVHAGDATRVAAGYADADGNYVADRIQTGNYKVRVRHDATYGSEWYGDSPSLAAGLPVPVRQGATTSGIDVELGPDMAYLQGRVTDNLGNPISGVLVSAFDEAGINVAGANTDEAGNYSIPRLSTGEVRIYFDAAPAQGNYYSKYFPNEDLLTGAIPIPVKAGETTSGIDAQLSDGGTISGRVTGAPGIGMPGISVRCFDTNGDRYFGTTTDAAGNYTLAHIWPDDYKVLFRPETGSLAAEWYSDWSSSSGARAITVGAGQVVSGIDAQLAAQGGSISGTATGTGPIKNVQVLAYDSTRGTLGAHISSTATDAAGTYRIPRLPGTEYKVFFNTDRNFLGYNSEYYQSENKFADAWPVTVVLGQEYPGIGAVLSDRPPLEITTTSLPEGKQSTFYSASLEASGGRPFYFWSFETGALPNGLTLNGKGEIRGNPSATGTFNFTVRVTDSTRPQQSDTQAFTVTIGAYTGTTYAISGKVMAGVLPVPGVVLDGLPGAPVTNASGQYSATVASGWTGTVTPTLMGYAFNPPSRAYTNVETGHPNQDYVASPGWAISGTIMLGGTPLPGVLMSGLPGEPRTNASGSYSAAVPAGWSGSVAPNLPGFSFDPPSRDYTDLTSHQAGQDFAAAYIGGADDGFEENDSYESAAVITPGTYPDLIQNRNEDWYKVYIPSSDAGKILRIRIKGMYFPTGSFSFQLYVVSENGKLLASSSSGTEQFIYLPDLAEGWYYIGQRYTGRSGTIYSLSVDIGTDFGLGFIEGRVMDEQGNGIDGVTIQLSSVDIQTPQTILPPVITTYADGTYKFGWTPGNFNVMFNSTTWRHTNPWALDPNYINQTYKNNSNQIFSLVPGSGFSGIDARLAAGGTVTGRVTDLEGNALESSNIVLYNAAGTSVGSASSGVDGSYFIERIPAGNYKARFRAGYPGYGHAWYPTAGSFDDGALVPVTAGQTTSDINGSLGPEGAIEGVVTDSYGQPIYRATVSAYDTAGNSISSVRTDESGHYVLNRLPNGPVKIGFASGLSSQNYPVFFYPDKLRIQEAVPVLAASGQTTSGIDVQMPEGGTISGRVTDTAGNGLAVTVICMDIETDRSYVAGTDADGYYTIARVFPDTYKIRFRLARGNWGYEWFDNKDTFSAGDPVAVGAGESVENIDGHLEENGGFITGRVTDTTGMPVAGLIVWARDSAKTTNLYDPGTRTDMEGNYRIGRLGSGNVKVHFDTDFTFLPYAAVYFNGKPTFETADLVPAARGETTANINTVLSPIPLVITSTSIPGGQQYYSYYVKLDITGGRPFYYWSLASGSNPLPPGLTLSDKGEILGTPTATGTFDFTVRVTDSTRPQQSDTQALTITVGAYTGGGLVVSGRVTKNGAPLPGIIMAGLPGDPATNEMGAYSVTVSSGWSGTVMPALADHAFQPTTRTYTGLTSNALDQDYKAEEGRIISGTITLRGSPLEGVIIYGLPGEPRTGANGFYAALVPTGWSGTATAAFPFFAFSPPSRDYVNVTASLTAQDYEASYVGGEDNAFEDNDSFDTAAVITPGSYSGLVLTDEDWYKVYIPAEDAGKILKVHVKGLAYPTPTTRHDLDFYVIDQNRKLLSYNIRGGDDEYAYIPDLAEGWYTVGLTYIPRAGTVYSLSVEVGTNFGLGFVEGRVTDEQGNGIEGVYVELYVDPTDWNVCQPLITTRADGTYKIAWTPGRYTVYFNNQDWSHRDPWAPDVNYIYGVYNPSLPMSLAAGATISGVDARLAVGGSISGRVTDTAGNGLRGVSVRVYDANALNFFSASTDPNGLYTIDRIWTGNYKMLFVHGSVEPGLTWSGDRRSFDEAIPVPVQGGLTTPDIDCRLGLVAGGYVEGIVTNSAGEPLSGVRVQAYDVAVNYLPSLFRFGPISLITVQTDSSGHYRLGPLPQGQVKIGFTPPTGQNKVAEYYPDTILFEEAGAVMVRPGETTAGIDAQLAEGGRISGQVTDAAGNPLRGVQVWALYTDSDKYQIGVTDAAGNYIINYLPARDYKILFQPLGIADLATEWFDGQGGYSQGSVITLGPGQSIEGINAQLENDGARITGHVTGLGSAPVKNVYVVVRDSVKRYPGFAAVYGLDAAGNYALRRLPSGNFKVSFVCDWLDGFLAYDTQYYNGKSTYETADPVTTVRGETTEGIDAVLAPIPNLTISTASLPDGQIGALYDTSLGASGGRPFYYFQLISGTLPHGLTLNGKGEIFGVPAAMGTYEFTVRVIDSTRPQQSATQSLAIMIGTYAGQGHAIAGRIMTSGTIPITGVVLSGLPGNPVTNGYGEYVAVVASGWSGTVTPTLAGYAFDPLTRTYADVTTNYLNQNYLALPAYAISGTVTVNGAPLPGVLISGLPGEPRTNASGNYSVYVPEGWSGTVVPTAPGFTFSPPSRTYTNVASAQSAQDYTAVFAGGVDDAYENNDDFASAREIPLGITTNLVANNEDWFKVYVNPGQDLKIESKGLAVPNPTAYQDLDFVVFDSTHKLLASTASSATDETIYLCSVAGGWYTIGMNLFGQAGTVYSLTVETGNAFGIGYVTGRVTDSLGNGLGNTFVELQQEAFNWGVSWPIVLTDDQGYYKAGYAPGRYRIVYNSNSIPAFNYAWAPNADYVGTSSEDFVTLAAGVTLTGNDVQLDQAGSISGRVTDPTGNSVGNTGALVYAYDSLNRAVSYGWANAEGNYRIPHIPPGNYKLRVRSSGQVYSYEWYENTSGIEDASPVPVQAGAITPGVDFRLEDWSEVQGFVQGHVTDAAGNPLNGVTVTAYDSAGVAAGTGGTGWSGGGNYGISRLRPGSYRLFFTVATTAGNFVSEYHPDKRMLSEAVPVQVQAGQTVWGIDAQLATAGTISGRVTDGAGNGIYGVNVFAMDIETDLYYSATTNATGNYSIIRVLPDVYKIRFRAGMGSWATEWFDDKADFMAGDIVTVGAAQTVENINVRLEDNGGFITGQVTGIGGLPVWGVRVSARDSVKGGQIAQGFTNPAGQYTIQRLSTGQAKVTFDTDANYLAYITEHYNDKGTLEAGDLVATARGGTTANINAVLGPVPGLVITTASLANGELGTAYNAVLQASGGRPFYYFQLESGSLPHGLMLNSKGEIGGTPTAMGTFNFTVRLTDSARPQQIHAQAFAITIGAYTGLGHSVSGRVMAAGPAPLPGVVLDGLPGNPVTNILGEYVAVVPPGWSGTVSPFLGTYSFAPPSRTYTNLTSSLVGEDYAAYIGNTLYVSTGGVPSGRTGSSYGYIVVAQGGTPPYSWTAASGRLPGGLTLSASGQISGTPTEGGEFPWTVRVTDSSSPSLSATRSFSLIINPAHQASWTTTYPLGGQVNPMGLIQDPVNPGTMYAVVNNRGIYKSTNGGASWTNFTESATSASGTWFDAKYLNVFLIGHESQFYMAGNWGLFKSLNLGAYWTRMDAGFSGTIISMALDPANGNTIYAGTREGKVYSSTNGGTSWSDMSAGLPATEIRFLAVDPADPTKIYAGTVSNGIYKSVGGGAWTSINGVWAIDLSSTHLTWVNTIVFDPRPPAKIFIAANDSGLGDGIYKTTDEGATWSRVTPQIGIRWQPGYYIAPNPADPGGIFAVNGGNIRKYSGDGTGYSDHYVADNSLVCLAVDPITPVLYAGTDRDGVFKSVDGGQTWTAVNNNIRAQSFPNFEAHSLQIDTSNPDIIFAGSMGGGYRSLDGGDSWVRMNHPDWGIRAFAAHSSIPGTVYSIGNWVNKSAASGAPGSWADPSGGAFSGLWDSDLVIVPSAPDALYAGVYSPDPGKAGVWKSLDGGATWAPKNVGLTDTKVNTLTIHPSLPNILFASTRLQDPTQQGLNTRLFRTLDGGESWQQVICGLPDTLGVTQVVFAPSDPNIMYLSAIGWNRGLYKSTDGGGCWVKLNSYNIATVAVHPADPDIVYLGTFGSPGFYISFNGAQTWTQFNAGLHPNPWVDSIALDPRDPFHVFLGTNAGVYETTLTADMVITTMALPNAIINQPYSSALRAAGGTPPFSWAIGPPGSLPAGLSLDPATGIISGQTAAAGQFPIEVRVVDRDSRSFTRTLTLNVLAMYPLAANPAPPEGGAVTRTPDEPLYTQGAIVKVEAVPNPGYSFIGWSGDISGTASTELVVMVESKSIQASFALTSALPDYHVSSASFPATAAAGETISGSVNIAIGNLGAGTANPPAVSAGVYLSKDALITPEDTLLWKGRVSFAPLGSGETLALPIDPGLQIPTTIAAGSYTIGVLVDDINGVVEGNESNNSSSQMITVSTTGFSHLELLGGWPYGSTIGVDADASRQVVLRGHGGLVEIVDISNPSRPRVISQLNVGPGQVNGIKIIGNLAYFAGGTKFFIADISDLHNPQIIGSCGGLLSNIRDFDIAGNYAYVSDYHYGMRVINISVPAAPAVVGSLPLPDCRTRLVKAYGNIVYVTRQTHVARPYGVAGLSIVDVSDPAHPVERTFLQNLSVGDLAVDKTGRYLFVMGQNTSLKIYDVLNPAAPIEVASYGGTFSPGGIKVIGDRAYLTDAYQNKAVILDVSDPVHPAEISSFQFLDSTALARPAAAGDLFFVTSWYDALRIVDFSNPSSPAQVGFLETIGLSNFADVANGQAYVATSRTTSSRLKVLNLANLSNITQTASLETPYGVNDVAASGIHAYLSNNGTGLHTVDVSDPAHPVEVGSTLSAPQAQDIVISGNYAYVADGFNGLKIFDIRTPGKPGLLGACPTAGRAYQLAVSGRYAYLACDTQGLRIIDISDPQNPRIVGSRVFSEAAYNVAVWESHAYVINASQDILWVVDVSDPANPIERAILNVYFCYGDLGFSGHYMFIPNTFFGLKIVDISNPASPVEVAVDRRLASACDVTVRDNRIYVVDRDAGFYVLEFRTTSESGPPIFNETFESSPTGSIPNGWSVANPGVSIAVSDARAQEGGRSLYIRGSPYNGANLDKYVSDLGISSGVYKFSFYMSADPINWTGSDGYAIGHLQIQGYTYAMGIKKAAGLYQLCMYGVPERTVAFPGSVDAWNKYEMLIDIDSHSLDFYLNGTKVDSNTAENYGVSDRIQLAAGASGPGGGCPTVYYDLVTIEKIR